MPIFNSKLQSKVKSYILRFTQDDNNNQDDKIKTLPDSSVPYNLSPVPSPKGFTLIELLVVITILGVLAAIILASGAMLQKYGRDGRRQSDLRSIQAALQQYYVDQNFYPASGLSTPLNLDTTTSLTSSTGNPNPPSIVRTYLSKIPKDPLGTNPKYLYVAKPDQFADCNNTNRICSNYCLYAKLEFSQGNLLFFCSDIGTYNLELSNP